MSRSAPRVLVVAALVAVGFVAGARPIAADQSAPLILTHKGPKPIRIRVAAGEAMPCDSSTNKKLFDGRLGSGQELRADVGSRCVCYEHTFEGMDTDWSTPELACRPVICTGLGVLRHCQPAPDPTIRVTLTSTR